MEKEGMILVEVKEGVKYLKRHSFEMMQLFSRVQIIKIFKAVKAGHICVSYCLGDFPSDLPLFRLIATEMNVLMMHEKYGLNLSKCKIFIVK